MTFNLNSFSIITFSNNNLVIYIRNAAIEAVNVINCSILTQYLSNLNYAPIPANSVISLNQ